MIIVNKEIRRWLGIWLNSQLKFLSHINKRVKKACIPEIQIKGLIKTQRLMPRLVRQIQLAMI